MRGPAYPGWRDLPVITGESMTYPPQQPGPYGPQDPYGQQPPHGQPQYGQPQYGQPQYGQPQYGQPQYGPGPWGQQPGYPPPKKSRTALVTTLVIVAVLVIGGGVAAYLLLKDDGGGSGDNDRRAAADRFTKTMSSQLSTTLDDVDLSPLKPLTCADDYQRLDSELKDARESDSSEDDDPAKVTFGVTNFTETSDGATFDMTIRDGSKSEQQPMDVVKEQDAWVVCGLYKDRPDGGSDEPGTSTSEDDGQDGSEDGSEGGGNGTIPNPIPKTS
jgi:hypothetical protein